jgi:23S rRNA G2069 N7-methylase RlmK/C1962 C5-methylase RlmI
MTLLPEKFRSLPHGVRNPFLYQDENWLVANKPTGLSTHAPEEGALGLTEWLKLHHGLRVHICSRLDKGTSGVLLFALNSAASALAEKIHGSHQARKTYDFISDRAPNRGPAWTCRQNLDGKPCSTTFRVLRQGQGLTLFRAVISHGRRHQIRRHAALSGIPILGDSEHGGTSFPRLCLHCSETRWPPIAEKLSAGLPQSFHWLLDGQDRTLIETAVAFERRLGWLLTVSDAFRLVHRGELSELPCAVDLYGPWLCVSTEEGPLGTSALKNTLKPALAYLEKLFRCKGGIIRTHRTDPHHRELFGEVCCWGEPIPPAFWVREHDLFYEAALNDRQHVGLFLDQRDSRRRLCLAAADKRVANLFAFTCSFSATAIHGGAETAFSVDAAAGCLDRGKHNFARNGLAEDGRAKFIREDVRQWLARQKRRKNELGKNFQAWDLIVCDPPVFASTGKGRAFVLEKAWPELVQDVRAILADDGSALFANNHRSGNEEFYAAELRKFFAKVTRLRPPFDFPERPGNPPQVRIFWCEA